MDNNYNYYSFKQTNGKVTLFVEYRHPIPIRGTAGPYTVSATLTVGSTSVSMTGKEWDAFAELSVALSAERLENAINQVQSELFMEDDEFENNEENN